MLGTLAKAGEPGPPEYMVYATGTRAGTAAFGNGVN